MWPSLIAAFSLGLVGSAHCVGMCGPLVLALPVQGSGVLQRGVRVGMYHAGRIMVYALGGLLFGLLGRRVYLAGWQQGLSVLLGVSILCWIVLKRIHARLRVGGLFGRFYNWLHTSMARLWHSPGRGKFLLLGMANGLLPCGMVYMAIAAALTSRTIAQAVGFMAFFGLGTLPMLLGLQITGRMVPISLRQQIRKALPYLTAGLAVLLILRGLNLGIPFVSPVLAGGRGATISCH
ncbi:MAG TPA: sulfite exporter TauE/SafE family protein [Puia sp.]|nr:sulfite exporter TauE/SafE family protein [Puia sp.]